MSEISKICCEVILILIVMDVFCGVTGAMKYHELSSTKAREGMYNKLGEIMFTIFGTICGVIFNIEPLTTLGIPTGIAFFVYSYVILAECLSIIENICRINPEIKLAKVLLMFNLDKDEIDTVESKSAPDK